MIDCETVQPEDAIRCLPEYGYALTFSAKHDQAAIEIQLTMPQTCVSVDDVCLTVAA